MNLQGNCRIRAQTALLLLLVWVASVAVIAPMRLCCPRENGQLRTVSVRCPSSGSGGSCCCDSAASPGKDCGCALKASPRAPLDECYPLPEKRVCERTNDSVGAHVPGPILIVPQIGPALALAQHPNLLLQSNTKQPRRLRAPPQTV